MITDLKSSKVCIIRRSIEASPNCKWTICTFSVTDRTSDLLQALLRLAERCFNLLNYHTDQVSGVTLSSPITFLRIMHQIQPLFKGGGYVEFFLTSEIGNVGNNCIYKLFGGKGKLVDQLPWT